MLHPIQFLILIAICFDFLLSLFIRKIRFSKKRAIAYSSIKCLLIIGLLIFFFPSTVNFKIWLNFDWSLTSIVTFFLIFISLTIPNNKMRQITSLTVSIFCIVYSTIWLQKTLEVKGDIDVRVASVSNFIINFSAYSILLINAMLNFFKLRKRS